MSKFFIPNSFQSSGIEQNPDKGVSVFRISSQSVIKEGCHNSKLSYDIDRKLGTVNKPDKRNMATSKKFDCDVMYLNSDIIVIFSIYGQLGAVWKPDSECMVCKLYIFVNNNLLYYKN